MNQLGLLHWMVIDSKQVEGQSKSPPHTTCFLCFVFNAATLRRTSIATKRIHSLHVYSDAWQAMWYSLVLQAVQLRALWEDPL
jgi:hypothetical protein